MSETLLQQIFAHKRTEVERQRRKVPLERLLPLVEQAPEPRHVVATLRHPERITLIAEVKKASPSKGVLLPNFQPLELAETYAEHGASMISVLTDIRFFQGNITYIRQIRDHLTALGFKTPLLRKDFIFDPYQIYEARVYGADAVLLIAAMLEDEKLVELYELTHELGMTPLIEVHTAEEMQQVESLNAPIIGINNRDLNTFEVNLKTTQELSQLLPVINAPTRPILVSESGIFSAADVALVRSWGVDSILVGESLIVAEDRVAQIQALLRG